MPASSRLAKPLLSPERMAMLLLRLETRGRVLVVPWLTFRLPLWGVSTVSCSSEVVVEFP